MNQEPYSLEAEQACLGSMMLEADALTNGIELLSRAQFYRPAHQEVFDCLKQMWFERSPVDIITLQERLKQRQTLTEVGGTEYLMALVESVPTASNLGHYASIVKRKSALRELISKGNALVALGYSDRDDIDAVAEATKTLLEVSAHTVKPTRSVLDIAVSAGKRLELLSSGGDKRIIPFRMEAMRNMLYGMAPGELGIVVGPTGGGKTVELLDFTTTAGELQHPVLLVSLEMDAEDLIIRMACSDTMHSLHDIRKGDVDWQPIVNKLAEYANYPLTIKDHRMTLTQLEITARRWRAANGSQIDEVGGLIVIDYFGIVRFDRRADSKLDAQGMMAADLKELARELNVAIWTGLQVRKKQQGTARPADIDEAKGSGDIVNEADKVIIISPQGEPDEHHKQQINLVVAKHRGGPTGKIPCMFDRQHLRMYECELNMPMQEMDRAPAWWGDKSNEEDV